MAIRDMFDWLRRRPAVEEADDNLPYRAEPRLPLHVLAQDAALSIAEGQLQVDCAAGAQTLRLDELSLVALHGGASVTVPCLAALARSGVPLVLHARSGHYLGQLVDLSNRPAKVRRAQYAAAADPDRRLAIARALILGKLRATARLARRRLGAKHPLIRQLDRALVAATRARTDASLRGIEGASAAAWYGAWPEMLVPRDDTLFVFDGRSRRPPQDAVNALLSYLYAVLAGTAAAATAVAGLDPMIGFLHGERSGRPALALDLMEPFRVAVVDAAVLQAVNNREFDAESFETGLEGGIRLTEAGRRRALACFERRLSMSFLHDGAEVTWRSAIDRLAADLANCLPNPAANLVVPGPK